MSVSRYKKRGRRAGAVHCKPHSKTLGQRWHGFMRSTTAAINLSAVEAQAAEAEKKAEYLEPWECGRCGALYGPLVARCVPCESRIEVATEADYLRYIEEHEGRPRQCCAGDCDGLPDEGEDFCAFHDELNEQNDRHDARAWVPLTVAEGKWDGFGVVVAPKYALRSFAEEAAIANRRKRKSEGHERRIASQQRRQKEAIERNHRRAEREARRRLRLESEIIRRAEREARCQLRLEIQQRLIADRVARQERRRARLETRLRLIAERRVARESDRKVRLETHLRLIAERMATREADRKARLEAHLRTVAERQESQLARMAQAVEKESALATRRIERAKMLHDRSKWGGLIDTLTERGAAVLPADNAKQEANRLRSMLQTSRRTCKHHWNVSVTGEQIYVKRGELWLDPGMPGYEEVA